ncbi:MAG: hypothetical protein J6I37_08305 [Prevotella sp.]|nr:hypothetical protein [Prevotella sp.]
MEYALFKNRSYRGVISAGFGLYFSHFRLFFKASWVMAVIFAVVFATLEMLLSVQLPALSATIMKQELVLRTELSPEVAQQYLMAIGITLLLGLLYVVVEALTTATVLNKLKEHHDTNTMMMPKRWFAISRRMMGRTLKGYVFIILTVLAPVVLVVFLLVALHHLMPAATMTLMIIVAVLFMLLGLMCFPMLFVFVKYVMNQGKSYFHLLRPSYIIGLRHWGHIFTTCLIGGMIVCVMAGICCLPAIILAQAHWISQEGFLNGDPLGMPDYINMMSYITYFLTGFILIYLCMPMLMIWYYMYGSIETYEQEKNKLDI